MIKVKGLTKNYSTKDEVVVALKAISFDLPDRGLVVVSGKSGCGKTTLVNCLAGIEKIDQGDIEIDGVNLKDMSLSQLDLYRSNYVGLIFQDYNLVNELTVGQNIDISYQIQGKKVDTDTIDNILGQVDLKGYQNRKVNQLSGGQKQRVAIARALARQCKLIIADEPTGNLDEENGEIVWKLLQQQSKNLLVVVITHDQESAKKYGDRVITLKDGKVESYILRDIESAQSLDNNLQTDKFNASNTTKDNIIGGQKPRGLSFGYSLKLGAKVLLSKKLRLIFTILLPVFSIAMFGLAFSTVRWNEGTLRLQEWYNRDISIVTLGPGYNRRVTNNILTAMPSPTPNIDLFSAKQNTDAFGVYPLRIKMSESQYGYQLINDMGFGQSSFDGNENKLNFYYTGSDYKVMIQDDTAQQDLNIQMVYGTLPTNANQMAIPNILFEYLVKYGYWDYEKQVQIEPTDNEIDWEFLKTIKFGVEDSFRLGINDEVSNSHTVELSGVFDTEFDISDYYNQGGDGIPWQEKDGTVSTHSLYMTQAFMPILYDDIISTLQQKNYLLGVEYNQNNLTTALVKITGNLRKDKEIVGDMYVQSTKNDFFTRNRGFIQDMQKSVGIIAGVFVVFTALLITNFITASINSGKRLIGILRSMGVRARAVFAIYASESAIIAIVISILAFAIVAVIAPVLTATIVPVPIFFVDILLFLSLLGLSILVSALATAVPIVLQIKKPIIDVIRKS